MGKLDNIVKNEVEKADAAENARNLAEKLEILFGESSSPGPFYIVNRGMKAEHSAGHIEDGKGRKVDIELKLTTADQTGGFRIARRPNEYRGREDAIEKAEDNIYGMFIELTHSVDLGDGLRTSGETYLGRMVGIDKEGNFMIVNPDWDRPPTNESGVRTKQDDYEMFLDPEGDEYRDILMWINGTADIVEAEQKEKGE